MTQTDRKPIAASRRIMIVAADAGRLLDRRGTMIRDLTSARHRVTVVAAAMTAADRAQCAAMSLTARDFAMPGGGLRALADKPGVDALAAAISEHAPNVIVGFGVKPMLLAARAARRAPGVHVLAVASALDPLLTRPGLPTRWMMRRALKSVAAVVVYNQADARRLNDLDVLPGSVSLHILPGAGVDLRRFTAAPLPSLETGFVFAMAAPADPGKGIVDFCEAARRVKSKAPSARFRLALLPAQEETPLAMSMIDPFRDCVEIEVATTDIRSFLEACHVFVYPSVGEGLAHRVVEALATGRPAITTTAPGCAETVDERVSGVLVPPGDTVALATAMESFLRRPDLMAWMSKASRQKAERLFDAREASAGLIRLMKLDGVPH